MLISKYILFALFSAIVNLVSQYFFHVAYAGQYSLILGMIVGTATGLLTKYILDRDHIFEQEKQSNIQEARQLVGQVVC